MASTLELPTFKGRPGWEFTDLTGLDLEAYPPAEDDGEALDGVEQILDFSGDAETIAVPLEEAPEAAKRHLGTVVSSEDPFVALNAASPTRQMVVYVPKGVKLDAPVLLTAVQSQSNHSLNWRTLIVLDEGAEADVWEQYLSANEDVEGLFNVVTEIVVGPNAKLRYLSGQGLNEKSWIFGTQRAVVDRDGSFEWVALGFGSAKGKVRMETNLAGPGADAKVTGAYAGHGRQHLDFDTTQEHAAPNTVSDLAFRGVLDGRSTAVWRGMIRVDPGAQQTDAFQESRNLLLSKRAHADAIPGLEIEANDVRCTHAAAIAQIDKEQLFYLRSHGIPNDQATRLVIEGFLQELVERFPEEGYVHDALSQALERRLETILGAV